MKCCLGEFFKLRLKDKVRIYWKDVDFRSIEFVPYIFVTSDVQPNTFAEVPCRHNLENFYHEKWLMVSLSGRQIGK